MFAGGKCGGIYPTDTPATAGYKIVHSGGVVVCVETKSHFDKVCSALDERGDATRLKCIIGWGFDPEPGLGWSNKGTKVPLMGWKDALALGANQPDTDLDARLSATTPGNCCALIYTSGTTGDPKAVMISHDSLIYMTNTMMSVAGESGVGQSPDE